MSSEKHRNEKPAANVAGGRFDIDRKLGAGCFGEVWRGKDSVTGEQIAVKFEDFASRAPQLEHESDILKTIGKPIQPQGFAECHHFGLEGRFHCMVMELLGESLERRVRGCGGKFQVPTAVLIAEQALHRIEYLHSKGIIHRDIKPENFTFGLKDKIHHLYLIDFGLSKMYYDSNVQKHQLMRQKLSLTGTARYASISAHKGYEQSRRDDLEAIGHMLLYFLRGSLPWSGLEAKTQEQKYRKICEKKQEVSLDELCSGFPDAFKLFLRASRGLEFKQRPDYNAMRKLFRDVREQHSPLEDHQYQWFEGKDLGTLVPLSKGDPPRQPDDLPPKRGFCMCFGGSPVKG